MAPGKVHLLGPKSILYVQGELLNDFNLQKLFFFAIFFGLKMSYLLHCLAANHQMELRVDYKVRAGNLVLATEELLVLDAIGWNLEDFQLIYRKCIHINLIIVSFFLKI